MKPKSNNGKAMDSFVYFVPVDFSEGSYNALHYATMLARNSSGRINICHVIDLDDLPESDNSVVVSFALDRLVKTAEKKMRSLREIISMNGIIVKEDILIGNVKLELMKQIDSIKPGVVVLGRDTDKKLDTSGLLALLVRKISTPVLVIPKSHNPRSQGRAVLKSEITTKSKNGVATLFEIIKKVSNELSVLNIKSYFFSNAQDALNHIRHLHTTGPTDGEALPWKSQDGLNNILDFICTNKIDLHCAVESNTRPTFLGRFFSYNVINQLATQEETPVLVIKQ